MKKITSLLLFFGLFFSIPAFANFSDIDPSYIYYDAVTYVKESGIVNGYSNGTYGPENNINRAEFLKIIVEATYEREEIDDCIQNNDTGAWDNVFFPDVPKSDWYAKYVCLGKIKAIIKGDEDGFFRPADKINFVEAAKIIVQSFRYAERVGETAPWYKKYISALVERRAIPISIRATDSFLTRGEMAEMIYRLKEEITDKPFKKLLDFE